MGYGVLLKLTVSDDDGDVISRGKARAKLLSVACLKVFLGRDQNARGWIQPKELGGPLLRQVVGHDKHALLAQTQPLAFHGRGDHLKRLSCTYLMGQQRISAIEDMRDGVSLVFAQRDLRVHARKDDMPSIVLAGSNRIEQLVVLRHQRLTAVGVFPNPFPKGVLDGLLLLLGKGGRLLVEHPLFPPVCVLDGIVNAHIPQVQRIVMITCLYFVA